MSGRTAVVAVTSLSLEAHIALGPGVTVICNQPSRLVASLEAAIKRGAVGIISFGVAGGLAPYLGAGDWVIGSGVWSGQERHLTDRRWGRRLLDSLPGAIHADMAGAGAPVASAAEKRRLYERIGAVAVDMESHIAGTIAAAHKIPFAICRTVIDAAHRDLPPAALAGLRDDGTPDVVAVSRSVMRQPNQLPALARVAMDAWIARTALRRGRARLGAGFACPYLGEPSPAPSFAPRTLEPAHLRSAKS